MQSLCLFSGIGGLTHALKGLVKPMAYSEIDPAAIAVLEERMKAGALPRAAINMDVRTLTHAWLKANTRGKRTEPSVIVAGFPCVGFSLAGKREGYQNVESGLFKEILRLVDEFKAVKFMFLENVAAFLNDGMDHLVRELHTKSGFNLAWCLAEAREVGAPQLRRRWFCVAYRDKLPKPPAFTAGGYRPFASRWAIDPGNRTTCPGGKSDPSLEHGARKRASLLGNAVVPDCARYAFFHLLLTTVSSKSKDHQQAEKFPSGSCANRWPACGAIEGGTIRETPPPLPRAFREPLPITLDAKRYTPPERGYKPKNTLKPLRAKTTRQYWATPRANMNTGSQVMTSRTSHDLPTQVRTEVRTPDRERSCRVNPEFIEHLMGYSRGWTKAAALPRKDG